MEKILNKKIIHGRVLCNFVYNHYKGKLPEIEVSEDISIVTVVSKNIEKNNFLLNCNIRNNKINFIVVDKYIKWTSKIEGIINFIEENYERLPKYILYMDAIDAAIINDIIEPKKILDYYKCKILFNSEPDFWHTGAESPNNIKGYYDLLYYEVRDGYVLKNCNKFNIEKDIAKASLNAGVFLGEKDFTLKILKDVLNLMQGPANRKFPYGCMDDQCVLRYAHDRNYTDISIDIFQKMMLWGTDETLKDNNNSFNATFFQNYCQNYDNRVDDDLNIIITTSMSPFHPSTKHIDEVIESLKLINLPEKYKIIIAFDGKPESGHTEKYKEYIKKMFNKYGKNDKFILSVLPSYHENGLTGNIRYAINYATSENILIIQHDLPFIREFDIRKVLRDFNNNESIKHLRFNKRKNIEYGCDKITKNKNENLFGNVISGEYDYISTPCWSDNNHLTTVTYYKEIVFKECKDKVAMEVILFPKIKEEIDKNNNIEIKNLHNKYGTFIFDKLGSDEYIIHTDAYPKR